MLLELRQDAYIRVIQSSENLLAAVSQDIGRNIELYDLSLQEVQDEVNSPDVLTLSPRLRQLVLFDRAATAPYLGSILVEDEHGDVIYDAGSIIPRPGNFANRDYFVTQRDRPDVGLFISMPFRRRLTGNGDWVISLSRRINHPDGSFAGVVSGTLKLDYFRDLFAQFKFGPKSATTLLLTNGTVVARTPWNDLQLGLNIKNSDTFAKLSATPHGVFAGTSAVDGISRVYSFTRVAALPMILDVSVAESEIYADWYTQCLVIGAVLVLLSAAGIFFAGLLHRELRRRTAAERASQESEAKYRLLAGNATDVIIRLDGALKRTYISPASATMLGYLPEELLGTHLREIIHPDDVEAVLTSVTKAQSARQAAEIIYRLRHGTGHYVWVEGHYSFVPEDSGFIVVLRDITKRKKAEQELKSATAELARLATTDGLTGLANRRCFDERLEQEWRRAARDETSLSLLLLDVDNFKRFNDRYGHQAGDTCLRQVAAALGGTIRRPGDLTARYGGEELVVLLPGTDQDGASLLGERVRSSIERLAIQHEDNPEGGGLVTVSVGTATIIPIGQGAGNGAPLVAQADAALYEAKRAGRNRVEVSGLATTSTAPPLLPDEMLRLETLAVYEASGGTAPSLELDRITQLTASLLDAPEAYINLVGKDKQVLVSGTGLLVPFLPREASFCAHTIANRGVLVVDDARMDPRFRDNPLVIRENGLRFYAGAPLISPVNGQHLGALCVIDRVPRSSFGSGQISLLIRLAGLVANTMERQRLGGTLSFPRPEAPSSDDTSKTQR